MIENTWAQGAAAIAIVFLIGYLKLAPYIRVNKERLKRRKDKPDD